MYTCKHCGEWVRPTPNGWEHADGFTACIDDPYHPETSTVAEPKL